MRQFIIRALVSLLLPILGGCRSHPGVGIGPRATLVVGKVLYNNQPAVGVRVVLYPLPLEEKHSFLPSGLTDKDGMFRLSSYTAGDGAPPGQYALTIVWPASRSDQDDSTGEIDMLFHHYDNPRAPAWTVQIHDGSNEIGPFAIETVP